MRIRREINGEHRKWNNEETEINYITIAIFFMTCHFLININSNEMISYTKINQLIITGTKKYEMNSIIIIVMTIKK
jgi:hypothetical protein